MKYFFILSLSVFLIACGGNDPEIDPFDDGNGYFPMKEGFYREYEVREESFEVGTIDSNFYFLREEFEEITDKGDENQQLFRRFKRENETQEWEFDSIWVRTKNELNGFSVENGIRYNRLEFPLYVGKTWDINDFNTRDELEAKARQVGVSYGDYEDAMYVAIDSFFSLVNRDYAYEVYAKDIGLIEKHEEYLDHQPGKDTVGIRVHKTLLKHGVE